MIIIIIDGIVYFLEVPYCRDRSFVFCAEMAYVIVALSVMNQLHH
ncbi:MAG: hypothetical protein V7K43_15465 [Nostoc sp.]